MATIGHAYLPAFLAPMVLILIASVIGLGMNCNEQPNCPQPKWFTDWTFKHFGVFAVLPILILRWLTLPFHILEKEGIIGRWHGAETSSGSWWSWWYVGTAVVWIINFLFRWLLYYEMKWHPPTMFSDHLILYSSMLALLQMELVVAEWARSSGKFQMGQWFPTLFFGLIFVIAFAVETWNTSTHWHKPLHCVNAILLGMPIFCGGAFVWTWLLQASYKPSNQLNDGLTSKE